MPADRTPEYLKFTEESSAASKGEIMQKLLSFLLVVCMAFASFTNIHAQSTPEVPPPEAGTTSTETKETSTILDANSMAADAYKLDKLSDSPGINAESAVVMDARSGEVLYSREGKTKRYPASITKVMTALLAVENCSLDETVEYTSEVVNSIEPGSSTAGIGVGSKISMEDTLYALMLFSANEAGAAIAHHISGSDEEFAKLMTKRAKELGCKGTQFKNPHGLPDEEHYTTAYDMALIVRQAMMYDSFRTIAGTVYYTIENDTLPAPIELYNHAKIMQSGSEFYYKYVEGAKTGFTQAAHNTLVSYAKKGDVELVCVVLKEKPTADGVMGAHHSYLDTKALYEWAFGRVKTIKPLKNYDLEAALGEDSSTDSELADQIAYLHCSYDKGYSLLVPKDFDESSVSMTFRKEQDEKTGRFGYIDIKDGKKTISSVTVSYDPSVAVSDGKDSGKSDDLKSANVDDKRLTPGKILRFFIRLVLAIALILVIMRIITGIIHNKQKKKRRSAQRRKNSRRRR